MVFNNAILIDMSNEHTRGYTEIGQNSEQNTRLVNQIKLGEISPEITFFPRVLETEFDDTEGYQVEHIDGKTFGELIEEGMEAKQFIGLLIEAAQQQRQVYEQTGVIIKDRNKDNFIYGTRDNEDTPSIFQVDLESLYDSISGADHIANDIDLSQRTGKEDKQDQRLTEIEIADVSDSFIKIVIDYLKENRESDQERALYKKLNQTLGATRIKDFRTLIELLTEIQRIVG